MTRGLTSAVAAVPALALLLASPSAQQVPVFRTSVESVVVNVAVTRRGAPVTGLTSGDFVLLDNGRPQVIETVLEATPIDVTFLSAAVSRIIDPDLARIKAIGALASRVSAFLRPVDRLRKLEGAEQVTESRPMRELAAPIRPGQLINVRGSSLIDAVFHALAWPITPGRRHMIAVFTTGMDGRSSTLEAAMLPALAAKSDAILHAVLFATPDTAPVAGMRLVMDDWRDSLMHDWRDSHNALVEAVDRTGGTVHHGPRSEERLEKALEDFRSSYALHYTPQGVERGGWHEITVTLPNHPGVEIHARKGYSGG